MTKPKQNHRFDFLKASRKHRGWSYGQLSARANLAKGTVIAAEKREGNPHASTLRDLARCYGFSPSLLMDFDLTKEEFHRSVLNGSLVAGR